MKNSIFACLLLIGSTLACAQVVPTDMKDAMFSALDSSGGIYKGQLNGATGDEIRKITNSSGPVYVEITTVHVFQDPQCKRLKTNITAPSAKFKDTKTNKDAYFSYTFYMNLCPDGSPPVDGLHGIKANEGVQIIK